jgi:2-C-methyl-D-erythritol 4-phosphate cytidylyltransferase
MERKGVRAVLVQGSPFNIKVTRAADLAAAARILQSAENRAMSGKCE